MRKRESGLTGIEIAFMASWFPRQLLLEVKVHEYQRWLAIFRPFGGGLGLTLGPHIFCWGTVSLPFLAHELTHVHQQQCEFGLCRFLLVYLREWVKLRGHPISSHPLEAPAYRLQYEVQSKIAGYV